MPNHTIKTVPSEFAWVVEDAIAEALKLVERYQADPNLPGFLRHDRTGVTMVCLLRDAEGLSGVKVSSLVEARRNAKEQAA